jgi:transposase
MPNMDSTVDDLATDVIERCESKELDHLGLVAGMYDELEIGERIDEHISQDFEQRKVSIGQAVKAMVLNGLGFVRQSLYLTPQFFETRPTERLIGEGIEPDHLHDDTLGGALDSLYECGVTELFRDVSAHAIDQLGLTSRFAHLDATSFSFHGEYESEEEPEEEEPEDGVINIRKGYSRDHRPDLNQVVLDLMVEHQAGIPTLMEPLSGNASDQGSFPELIDRHISHLQRAHGFDYVVADSALYSADHVGDLDEMGTKFITRVPASISEAKQAVAEADVEEMEPLVEGYRGEVLRSGYGDVEQRWLLVWSEEAEQRAIDQAAKQLQREHAEEKKTFRELKEKEFACREDAEKALERFEEDLTASVLTEGRVLRAVHFTMDSDGRPVETGEERFLLQGQLVPSEARENELVKKKSLFIVATNELDEQKLSDEELLEGYKGQHSVERGFRFMKNPELLADPLYLQEEERIMALLMVMTLCLLVYSALQWRIRQGLKETGRSYPDQKGNPTQRPTARWVFQSFDGIHVLHVGQQRVVLNMKERHRTIVSVLGPNYERLYVSHPT